MSRSIVTAEDFWSKFAEGLKIKVEKDKSWKDKYTNNKLWTNFMYELLGDYVSVSYDYSKTRERSTEYLRTDMGFYDIDKITECIEKKYNGFEWDFDIAIEHENDETAWLDEFVKLVHINCGLKVLISYHRYSIKSDGISNDPETILGVAEKIYNSRKYKNLNDNWLMILGPCSKDMSKKDFVAYKSIINKEKETIKFVKLEEKQILHHK